MSTTPDPSATTARATHIAVLELGSGDAVGQVKSVIEERMAAVGVGLKFDGEDGNRLTIRLNDNQSEDFLARLIEVSGFSFKKLKLEGTLVRCHKDDGSGFTVSPALLTPGRDGSGQSILTCNAPDGSSGDVEWEETGLDSDMIQHAAMLSDPSQGELVVLEFNQEGAALFEEITSELVGYSIGMFFGDDLISAPTVVGTISGGTTVVQGLTAEELPLVLGAASGGQLPTTVRVVSIESQ